MPTVRFGDKKIECPQGANLRQVLLRARIPLYNGAARVMNCHGSGTCGTCAVKVEGPVSPMTTMEKVRLSLPPHDREAGLRLACQCSVLGDLDVTKYTGLFGQNIEPGAPKR
jgi:ferredoxin